MSKSKASPTSTQRPAQPVGVTYLPLALGAGAGEGVPGLAAQPGRLPRRHPSQPYQSASATNWYTSTLVR